MSEDGATAIGFKPKKSVALSGVIAGNTAICTVGRTGNDPAEREPMGIYWYQFRPGPKGVEWIRHIVDYGGRAGGGLQMIVEDMDGDGDRDVVTAGKTGVFLSENLTRSPKAGRAQ